MKRMIAVMMVTLFVTMTGFAWGANTERQPPLPRICTAQAFRPFSERVWRPSAWDRGNPPQNVLEAVRKREDCAPAGHREAMKAMWAKDREAYFRHRSQILWRKRVKPFVYPDGSHWAVPYPIAWCESGGNYYAGPSGAYGLIPPFPQYMAPRRQDEIAHRLYLEQGEGPWAPYEGGCQYR